MEQRRAGVRRWAVGALVALVGALGLGGAAVPRPALQPVIVQGSSVAAARAAVQAAGGRVDRELGIINGVSAAVPAPAVSSLEQRGFHTTADRTVTASDTVAQPAAAGGALYPPMAIGTNLLPGTATGDNITVAFVDSGFPAFADANKWNQRIDTKTLMAISGGRFIVYRDELYTGAQITNSSDPYGHGTHTALTVADARVIQPASRTAREVTAGIAPQSNIVMVRALDQNGAGNYASVIAAIDWIVSNRSAYNIRVLNLSLDGPPAAPYWYDPLGQAVMRAWQAGITVVAAAGNRGPSPMTIGVPGNVPYVITVGAIKGATFTDFSRGRTGHLFQRRPHRVRSLSSPIWWCQPRGRWRCCRTTRCWPPTKRRRTWCSRT